MPADYYADNAQQRRKRRRKRRSRRLLTLLLIAALVLTAYKVTDGFTRISMRTHVPKDNIETDFNIDLDAIAAQANSAGKGFSPSGADIEALNKTAANNPEYKEEIEFFIAHIGAYDQTGVNTVLLAPEKTPFVLLAPFAENTPTGGWDIEVKAGTVPYFIQYDSRWAFYSYGSSCMGNTACGPTCLSMAAAGLTGDGKYTPDYVSDYAKRNGYYVEGAGTAWSLYTDGAAGLGVSGRVIGTDKAAMKDCLDSGQVLIASVTPGDFTMAGHFIVIYGYNAAGFKVYDPSSIERSGMVWSFKTLAPQIAQIWSMSKA